MKIKYFYAIKNKIQSDKRHNSIDCRNPWQLTQLRRHVLVDRTELSSSNTLANILHCVPDLSLQYKINVKNKNNIKYRSINVYTRGNVFNCVPKYCYSSIKYRRVPPK